MNDSEFTVNETLVVNIVDVNEAPVFTSLPDDVIVEETDTGVVYTLSVYDVEGGALTVTMTTDPATSPSPFTFTSSAGTE